MASTRPNTWLGRSEKSARDTFFYYSGTDPSAVRYKNWKIYFAMVSDATGGFISGSLPITGPRSSTSSVIPSRPRLVADTRRSWAWAVHSRSPSTAYLYDWNMLPIGQALWLKELESYKEFPPMQDPASYNLDQVMQQIKNAKGAVGLTADDEHGGRPTSGARHPAIRHVDPRSPSNRQESRPSRRCAANDHRSSTEMLRTTLADGFGLLGRLLHGSRTAAASSSRSRTSSSSWATTSATGTSAPTTAA